MLSPGLAEGLAVLFLTAKPGLDEFDATRNIKREKHPLHGAAGGSWFLCVFFPSHTKIGHTGLVAVFLFMFLLLPLASVNLDLGAAWGGCCWLPLLLFTQGKYMCRRMGKCMHDTVGGSLPWYDGWWGSKEEGKREATMENGELKLGASLLCMLCRPFLFLIRQAHVCGVLWREEFTHKVQ